MGDEEKKWNPEAKTEQDNNDGDAPEEQSEARANTVIEEPNPYETGEYNMSGGAIRTESGARPKALIAVIAVLIVAMLVMAYFLFFKGPSKTETAGQIKQMQELAQKVQGLETGVKEKQDEIFGLVEEYRKQTGKDSLGVNALELSPKEQELLQHRIRDEKDVSVKSLLEDILDKNKEIRELKDRIAEIEELLPKPHIVQAGENHYEIAMDFLVNQKHLNKKDAMKLVERTALLDTMVPGFKVWNFYAEDEYGTSVTQGTAPISPNALIRSAKKKLVDARDQAISERDQLAGDIKKLEEKREQIIRQLASLQEEKSNLISKVSELNQQNQSMQETVNSLFYLMDTQKSLKQKNILKGGFLKSTKLNDVSPELYKLSVDLRTGSQIPVSAADLGISKIRDINLFPKFYKEGTDYKITVAPDKQTAAVLLLDAAKFKNERIVISVK